MKLRKKQRKTITRRAGARVPLNVLVDMGVPQLQRPKLCGRSKCVIQAVLA